MKLDLSNVDYQKNARWNDTKQKNQSERNVCKLRTNSTHLKKDSNNEHSTLNLRKFAKDQHVLMIHNMCIHNYVNSDVSYKGPTQCPNFIVQS